MSKEEAVRKVLAEFFGFMQYKIEKGSLTLEEEQALLKVIEESLPIFATADDLAGYYNKSTDAVHLVIHRRLLSKPKRRVLYNFKEFRKIVPDKWK